MPYFDEYEGIWITEENEDLAKAKGGNILTTEQRSRGGQRPKTRKHSSTPEHGRMMALARWAKHRHSPRHQARINAQLEADRHIRSR